MTKEEAEGYISYCVKEGTLDVDYAMEMDYLPDDVYIHEAQKMMDRGDYMADLAEDLAKDREIEEEMEK